MKKIITALAGILSACAIANGGINTPAFKLALSDGWSKEASQDPEQFSYYSKDLDVGLTTSSLLSHSLINK